MINRNLDVIDHVYRAIPLINQRMIHRPLRESVKFHALMGAGVLRKRKLPPFLPLPDQQTEVRAAHDRSPQGFHTVDEVEHYIGIGEVEARVLGPRVT